MFSMNAQAGQPPQQPPDPGEDGRRLEAGPSASRTVLSIRQRSCGGPIWRIETGLVGVGRAAWCPDRAALRQDRRDRTPAMIEGQAPLATVVDLEHALERVRRVRLPEWVVMAPHEDAFVPGVDERRRVEIAAMMRRLVRAGIGVALTTRGELRDADALLAVVREAPEAFSIRVGVFALDARLDEPRGVAASRQGVEAKWEAGLAPSIRRLALARALKELGARVEVEIGPIVPFANDDPKTLKDLVRAVSRAGIDTIAPRWIEDAPGLERQIEVEVTPSTARLVTGWFRQPGSSVGSATRRIIPLAVRKTRLGAIEEAAQGLRMKIATCACLQAGACVACHPGAAVRSSAQLSLFG